MIYLSFESHQDILFVWRNYGVACDLLIVTNAFNENYITIFFDDFTNRGANK